MTIKWIEDPSIEAPEGFRWMKPGPEDCPNCICHTARVCDTARWSEARPPVYPDGTAYKEPCPCEQQHQDRP